MNAEKTKYDKRILAVGPSFFFQWRNDLFKCHLCGNGRIPLFLNVFFFIFYFQVKEMYRTTSTQQEEEIRAKTAIVEDYKTITSQLSKRIEVLQKQHKEQLEKLRVSSDLLI